MRGGRTLSGGANDETRQRIVALAAAFIVNIAFLFALGFLMRPPRAVAVTSPRGFTGAMQVRLLDRSPAMAQIYGRDADKAEAQSTVLEGVQKRFDNADWKTRPADGKTLRSGKGRKPL